MSGIYENKKICKESNKEEGLRIKCKTTRAVSGTRMKVTIVSKRETSGRTSIALNFSHQLNPNLALV